jgi:hypothetical protein
VRLRCNGKEYEMGFKRVLLIVGMVLAVQSQALMSVGDDDVVGIVGDAGGNIVKPLAAVMIGVLTIAFLETYPPEMLAGLMHEQMQSLLDSWFSTAACQDTLREWCLKVEAGCFARDCIAFKEIARGVCLDVPVLLMQEIQDCLQQAMFCLNNQFGITK